MAVITISKEFASSGVNLAVRLADELGYKLAGKALFTQLAEKLGMTTANAELMHKGRGTSWFKLVDDVWLHTVRRISQQPEAALDDKSYFQAVESIVQELAQQGDVVIMGWGAQVLLANQPNTHHFRVVAPLELRAKRLAERCNKSQEEAKADCKYQDNTSSSFIKHYFNHRWDDACLYKMVLNMGAYDFNLDRGVQILKDAI